MIGILVYETYLNYHFGNLTNHHDMLTQISLVYIQMCICVKKIVRELELELFHVEEGLNMRHNFASQITY